MISAVVVCAVLLSAPAESESRIGLSAEALGGVMLFSSLNPFSFGLQPGASFGAAADVNFGRVLPVGNWGLEPTAELRWQYSRLTGGTNSFVSEAHHQAVTLLPGVALRFGRSSPWLLFAQVGAGAELVTVVGNDLSGTGMRGLFAYGGGIRFAPNRSGAFSLRLEVMRVHRDLRGDTWVGLGAGMKF